MELHFNSSVPDDEAGYLNPAQAPGGLARTVEPGLISMKSFLQADQPAADELPRPEYPRPDFQRADSSWQNLNGQWEFAFDDTNEGRAQSWQNHRRLPGDRHIQVPFAFQSRLSGLGDPSLHDHIWYACNFELPPGWAGRDQRFILHFGAVDYSCQVWVNGQTVGQHQGGHIPFSFDLTDRLKAAEPNRLVVYVEDTESKLQPRGKQYWKETSDFCFYTRTSGIWQTVWLEALPATYLDRLQLQTNIERGELDFTIEVSGDSTATDSEAAWLEAQVLLEGRPICQGRWAVGQANNIAGLPHKMVGCMPIPDARLWSPETPHLYDLTLTLHRNGQPLDRVQSYFGVRKISTADGRVLLNNQPYYLRLVLDQGYFPQGLLTAPTDQELRRDIELIKAFGFNGARKHQKIEDPRWLYWADRLGLLVWAEMPSAYQWEAEAELPLIEEWLQVIARDYNHPCIMTWVPFNESWGLEGLAHDPRQQGFVARVVALTRDLDKTRLVIDNDGWEHQDRASDLLTIHDYTAEGTQLFERYARFGQQNQAARLPLVSDRPILLPGSDYRGEPIIFTEFGGISLIPSDRFAEAQDGGKWGYSNAFEPSRLTEQYGGLIHALDQLGFSSGFCYTQLTDVEQEVNGLLTYDRQPKVSPETIARLNARLV